MDMTSVMDFINKLPSLVTHPAAMATYLVVAAMLIAATVWRNGKEHRIEELKLLPEGERRGYLDDMARRVPWLKAGMTSEEWLRYLRVVLSFVFTLAVLLIIVVFGVLYSQEQGKVEAVVTPEADTQPVTVGSARGSWDLTCVVVSCAVAQELPENGNSGFYEDLCQLELLEES